MLCGHEIEVPGERNSQSDCPTPKVVDELTNQNRPHNPPHTWNALKSGLEGIPSRVAVVKMKRRLVLVAFLGLLCAAGMEGAGAVCTWFFLHSQIAGHWRAVL